MKDNIDLTSNQMFSRTIFDGLSSNLMFSFKVPWDVITETTLVEEDLDLHSKFEAIRTGNKEERKLKKLCDDVASGNYCDRCGLSLNVIPWDMNNSTLCEKCEELLKREYENKDRCPWYKLKNEMIPNGEVISLLW